MDGKQASKDHIITKQKQDRPEEEDALEFLGVADIVDGGEGCVSREVDAALLLLLDVDH